MSTVIETAPVDLIAQPVPPAAAGTPAPIAASREQLHVGDGQTPALTSKPRGQPLQPRLTVRGAVVIAAVLGAATIVFAVTAGGPDPQPGVTDRTTGPTTSANIVRNGGFETPNIGVADFEVFDAGDRIGPWEVGNGQVDIVRNAFETAAGKQSLDINGLK